MSPSLASAHISRAALLAACVLLGATWGHGKPPTRAQDACRLATIWYAGDIHFHERLQLFRDGNGEWDSGGYDSDAHHGHEDFAWTDSGAALTFTYGDVTRTVPYRLEYYEQRHCFLTFDENPFLRDRGFRLFSTVE